MSSNVTQFCYNLPAILSAIGKKFSASVVSEFLFLLFCNVRCTTPYSVISTFFDFMQQLLLVLTPHISKVLL